MMKGKNKQKLGIGRNLGRIALGVFFVYAGIAHLTFGRRAFRAQVPNWMPATKDQTVLWSGYVEILLGLLVLFRGHRDPKIGWMIGAFLLAVFPGNWAQYKNQRNAFGLNTDTARFIRLFFQPPLIWLALWSMGAIHTSSQKRIEI
ncbi:DoxX family protein [Sphingobacterium corticibacter]|nr:DoxX family membrane protein [Sphingobacterium corticibacter]